MVVFRRPQHKRPTRHVRLSNCGPAVGVGAGEVAALLGALELGGRFSLHSTGEGAGHVHVSLESEEDAERVVRYLDGREVGGRKVAAKYSEVRPPRLGREVAGGDAGRNGGAKGSPCEGGAGSSPAGDEATGGRAVAARSPSDLRIPGLHLIEGFVGAEEEAALLRALAERPFARAARREVAHFGKTFDYVSRGVAAPGGERGGGPADTTPPIPSDLQTVCDRAAGWVRASTLAGTLEGIAGLPSTSADASGGRDATSAEASGGGEVTSPPPPSPRPWSPDQVTVNAYPLGVGLAPHVDTHSAFEGPILSLSLGSPAAMVFRRDGRPDLALALPPRSLAVLAGEARLAWQHYIPHRKLDPVALKRQGGPEGDPPAADRPSAADAPASSSGGPSPALGAPTFEEIPRGAPRTSITMRMTRRPSARGEPPTCACAFPAACDSQGGGAGPTRLALERAGRDPAAPLEAPLRDPSAASGPRADGGRPSGAGDVSPGQAAGTSPGAAAASPEALEASHVHAVYDRIAPHFSATRFAIWPAVRAFAAALPPAALVADVGCGNGKYFSLRRDVFVLGCDRSESLARVAASRLAAPAPEAANGYVPADVWVADCLSLPYRPDSCDAVISIAVLHHLSTPGRRLAALAAMRDVLRLGGRGLVTAWATRQDRMDKVARWGRIEVAGEERRSGREAAGAAPEESSSLDGGVDVLVPWHVPLHRLGNPAAPSGPAPSRKAAFGIPGPDSGELRPPAGASPGAGGPSAPLSAAGPEGAPLSVVDSEKGTLTFQRYYHLFEEGELGKLIEATPGLSLTALFYDKDNWCAEFERAG